MSAVWILGVVAAAFAAAALLRTSRRGAADAAARTWFLVAGLLALVACWLPRHTT